MTTTKEKFTVNYNDILREVLTEKGTISECYSMFHSFSILNQFIACSQLKALGLPIKPIACKSLWAKRGCEIKPEYENSAIWLRMPITKKYMETDENGDETENFRTFYNFKPNWFSFSQVQGKGGKKVFVKRPNEVDTTRFSVDKVVNKFGITKIDYDSVDGNCQGYCYPADKTYAISELAENPFKTTIHEIAHILLGHADVDDTRSIKELEAESVAYIVMSVLGSDDDVLEKMRGYIQGWFKGNEVPDKSAKKIMKVANDILKAGLGE